MPEATGPELAAVSREGESLASMPILFLSAETHPSRNALALAHGGEDFLVKPVRPAYLQAAAEARTPRSSRLAQINHAGVSETRRLLNVVLHSSVRSFVPN